MSSSQLSVLRAPPGQDPLLHSLTGTLSQPIPYNAHPLLAPGLCKRKSEMLSLLGNGLFAFEAGPKCLGLLYNLPASPAFAYTTTPGLLFV